MSPLLPPPTLSVSRGNCSTSCSSLRGACSHSHQPFVWFHCAITYQWISSQVESWPLLLSLLALNAWIQLWPVPTRPSTSLTLQSLHSLPYLPISLYSWRHQNCVNHESRLFPRLFWHLSITSHRWAMQPTNGSHLPFYLYRENSSISKQRINGLPSQP